MAFFSFFENVAVLLICYMYVGLQQVLGLVRLGWEVTMMLHCHITVGLTVAPTFWAAVTGFECIFWR